MGSAAPWIGFRLPVPSARKQAVQAHPGSIWHDHVREKACRRRTRRDPRTVTTVSKPPSLSTPSCWNGTLSLPFKNVIPTCTASVVDAANIAKDSDGLLIDDLGLHPDGIRLLRPRKMQVGRGGECHAEQEGGRNQGWCWKVWEAWDGRGSMTLLPDLWLIGRRACRRTAAGAGVLREAPSGPRQLDVRLG